MHTPQMQTQGTKTGMHQCSACTCMYIYVHTNYACSYMYVATFIDTILLMLAFFILESSGAEPQWRWSSEAILPRQPYLILLL